MEKGGEQGDEDNPFSFKAFLKRGAEDPAEKKKGKKPGTRKKKTQPATDTTAQGTNPFSFKNFVAARSTNDHDASDVVKVKDPLGLSNNSDSSDDDGDKNAVPVLSVSKTTKSSNFKHKRKDKLFSSSSDSSEFDSDSNTMTMNLPENRPKVLADKAIAPEINTPAVKKLVGDSTVLKTDISNPPLVSIGTTTVLDNADSDSGSSSSSEHSNVVLVTGTKSVLPNIVHNDSADITSFAYDETLLVENNKLKKDNEELKAEIATLKETIKSEKKKCSELKTKITALKKKESEETQALENMVANVEKNLVASTQRAATAEATIAELNKEIAILKGKLAAQDPEAIHQQHELVLTAVREKAAYASKNLYSAAEKADHSIRELMSGADTLKNIADILVYIDRVALTKSTS